jgi:hypothetical protein
MSKALVVSVRGAGDVDPIHIYVPPGPGPQGFVKSAAVVAAHPAPGLPLLKSLFINGIPDVPIALISTQVPHGIGLSDDTAVTVHCDQLTSDTSVNTRLNSSFFIFID